MSSFKGVLGETVINIAMWLKLEKDVYHRLNNITLPLANGGSTQIDHVIVSVYGVFVIETKNYKGWIFGGEHQKMWTQKIYKKSYKFQNPLHQNYKHQKVLESVLTDIVDSTQIHSIVVFMPDCEFKTQMPNNVFRSWAGWTDYVKQFKQINISPMKLKRIQYRLEKEILEKSWKTNRQHIQSLKDKYTEK